MSFLHGCCIVVQENYTLAEALRLIQRYEITQFAGVPTMIQMFEKGADSGQLASVRFFISGGASLPQKLAKDFKKKLESPYRRVMACQRLRRSVLLIRLKKSRSDQLDRSCRM